MIPKRIHYIWFGYNPMPPLAQKCINSWRKYCRDYEIIEWNENNYSIESAPEYVKEAYREKKWAFVTDYVRLQIIYENGGIYMDTDVELKKSLNPLLENTAYFGMEQDLYINTGLGFGAEKGCTILKEIMEDYEGIHFLLENGEIDNTPCPKRNTAIFLKHGFERIDKKQVLKSDILVLPSICLSPIDYMSGKRRFSFSTISVHHFAASWKSAEEETAFRKSVKEQRRELMIDKILRFPNRLLMKSIGKERYNCLKRVIKSWRK